MTNLSNAKIEDLLRSYKFLEDVCQFLEHKEHGIEGLSIGSSINHIVALKIQTHNKPHFMNMSLNEH